MIRYFLILAIIDMTFINIVFIYALYKKRNDVMDIAWGLGFILLSWSSLILFDHVSYYGIIASILVTLWGLRLSIHIYLRNKNKQEDFRYSSFRQQWGKYFYIKSYIYVYLLQGILLFIISLPIFAINNYSHHKLSLSYCFFIIVWLIGFLCEAISDIQLSYFLKDVSNQGKIMQAGLWAYSRHPNYFGEILQWWALWLMSLSLSINNIIFIVSPIIITYLLIYVSGIPLLEQKMRSKADFHIYKKRVSKIIPLPTRQY